MSNKNPEIQIGGSATGANAVEPSLGSPRGSAPKLPVYGALDGEILGALERIAVAQEKTNELLAQLVDDE